MRVLVFSAGWCSGCVAMKPALAAAGAGFETLDVDANPQATAAFNVTALPTLIRLVDGRETARASGARDVSGLRRFRDSGGVEPAPCCPIVPPSTGLPPVESFGEASTVIGPVRRRPAVRRSTRPSPLPARTHAQQTTPPRTEQSRPLRRRAGREPRSDRTPDRKTLQLCGQVRKTLEYVLSGETGDDLLRQLYVADVMPAPDASRLLATLAPIDPRADLDSVAVMEKLGFAQPLLRSAVARAINRKKVPDLTFTLAGPAFGLPDPAVATPQIGEPRTVRLPPVNAAVRRWTPTPCSPPPPRSEPAPTPAPKPTPTRKSDPRGEPGLPRAE